MSKPNYAVKALIPHPSLYREEITEIGIIKKADNAISEYFFARRKIYRLMLLSFLIFSALGLFYYSYAAENLVPISLYTPDGTESGIGISSLYLFRRLHIFAFLFTMLSGFTVFGKPVSLIFIASDSFIIGFSLKYSMTHLLDKASMGVVFIFFILICN